MKKIKQYLLIGVILLGGIFIFWRGQPQKKEQSTADYRYQAEKPRVVSYSRGEKRWDLLAESVLEPKQEKKETQRMVLKRIKNGKLFSGGKVEYKLDADKIIYYNQSKNATLLGGVRLKQVDGQEIITSRLEWIDAEEMLATEEGVKIKLANGGQITAEKMKVNVQEEIIDLDKRVETTFVVEGADKDEK